MSEPTIARRVVIRGLVQEVGYRAWTANRARELGLLGWVRNRRDGTVEAVLQGPAATIAQMLADCRAGPTYSEVTDVEPHDAPVEAWYGFEVRPTA